MRKILVKFFAKIGWWRVAYYLSPSLARYYAAVGLAEAIQEGLAKKDGDSV